MLDGKLQLKNGRTMAVINEPYEVEMAAARASTDAADAVLVFVMNRAALEERIAVLRDAAARGALAWLAYPKAKELQSDLNRDIIRDLAQDRGLDPVRQVSIDEVWSGLRVKLLV